MPDYKIIASDLDGTLLRGDMTVSEKNLSAMNELCEMGITLALTSGRTLYEIPEEVRENKNIRYITYSNGTAVYDKVLGVDIISNRISKESVNAVFDAICGYETMISVHSDGHAHFEKEKNNDDAFAYYQVNDYYKTLLTKVNMIDGLEAFSRNSDSIESIVMFFHSDAELEDCRSRLEKIDGLTVTSSIGHNIEICSEKAGKGEALRALAEALAVAGEDIISIGDNMNDTSMFPVSGLALCVGNGSDEAKELADEVICTNEEDALDYVLTHYITKAQPEPTKTKKKTLAIIIAACSAVVAIFFSIIAIIISNSVTKVGYSGIKNSSSWSGTYIKLDGEMSHSLTPKNGELRISVTTESGEFSIEIKDSKGNTIFDEENVGTQEFIIDTDGKIYIDIEADDHKGGFVIG